MTLAATEEDMHIKIPGELLWDPPEIIAEYILSKWPQIAGESMNAEIQTLKRDTYRWVAAAGYLVTVAEGTEDEYLQLLKADPDEAIKYTFAVRIALAESKYNQEYPGSVSKHGICYKREPQPIGTVCSSRDLCYCLANISVVAYENYPRNMF